jgi:RecA-family ATPase
VSNLTFNKDVNGGIPFSRKLQELLNAPRATNGARHEDIKQISFQMVAQGFDDATIFATLRQRYPDPEKSDREINDLIAGARRLNPQPAAGAHAYQQHYQRFDYQAKPKVKPLELNITGEITELPKVELTTIDWLKKVFRPGEVVCVNKTAEFREGKWVISASGTFQTLEWWCEKLSDPEWAKRYDCPQGAWVRVNPFKETEEGSPDGTDKDVADFRNLMIESDSRPKVEQFEVFKKSGLPIACVTDSGGKSLHALVRVNAANAEEYKERCAMVYEALSGLGFDPNNKNASRFTRLPGAVRAGVKQQLIATEFGAANWQEWEYSHQTSSTEWFDLYSLGSFDRENDPNCRIGNRWLCKGGSLVIQGYSGIGKSSFALQMALNWAVGKDFFGLKPIQPLNTVFIQAENDLGDFAEPYQDITKGWGDEEKALLRSNFHAGREAATAGAEKFAAYVRRLVAMHNPDILFFDPLLSYFGDDISKQKAASEFFRNHLQPIQNETGVIIVFIHHLGKPSQNANGQRQGPAHYQGLGSSDIINWTRETIMLSEETEGIFKMELGKRAGRAGFKEAYLKHSATGVLWEQAEGIKDHGDAMGKAEAKKREKLESFVREFEIVTLPQMKNHASAFGYGKNAIKDALEALAQNSVEAENPIYCYQAHVNGAKYNTTVFSINPKPEDGNVQSKDIDPKIQVVWQRAS